LERSPGDASAVRVERATVNAVTQVRRPVHDYWFAFFGAHSEPRGRLLCMATALAFLAFPLSDLLSGRLSRGSEVVAAAGLVAFAAGYARLFWILPSITTERRREGGALLAALATLAVALSIAFGDEWLGLLVYLSIALALALSTRLALVGIAAVAAAAVAITGELDVAVQVIAFGVILVGVRRLMELVRELEAARAQVAELAAREERLRLSRDMHDLLGHHLSLIALKSQLARKLMGRDAGAAEREVRDIESVARSSLEEARAAVRGLRRASLDAELDAAREVLKAAGLDVVVHSAGPLPAGVETLLGFTAREGATNVIRHSGASRCEILVRRVGDVAELEVRDDGTGAPTAAGEGSGLRGLAERMAEAGGTLEAGPAAEGGFRLLARVPIATSVGPRREGAPEPVATGQ
jgi:two-component system, NarL family, sensor histidine kinase DesK